MQKDMIVIDNFYANPDQVRNFAINVTDWVDNGLKYEIRKCYFTETMTSKLEELVGSKLNADPRVMGYGPFTYFPDRGVEKYTHYDDNEWVGIVYLIPNEMCKKVGLSFGRHKESGLMGPPDEEWLENNGYSSFENWVINVYNQDKPCIDKWESLCQLSITV